MSRFPNRERQTGTKGGPFVPGLATGTKGAASATWLAHPFVPVGVTNRDKMVLFVPVARPGTKGHPLLSRPGVPGWETGTIEVSQPGQISVSVVVIVHKIPYCDNDTK